MSEEIAIFLCILINVFRMCRFAHARGKKREKWRGTTACLFSKLVRKCFYDVDKMKYYL